MKVCEGGGKSGQGKAIRAILLLLAVAWILNSAACRFSADADEWRTVIHVNDGDTVVLDGEPAQRVRYLGIDTPEIDHHRQKAEPFAMEALALNRQLVLNRKVRLEFDRERTDRYGRWLTYVFTENGTFVNREILLQGLGFCLFKPPNTRHEASLLEAQRSAMKTGRGLWKGWSEVGGSYIGNRNSRVFHRPSCPNGRKMAQRNRVHFDSRWEAFWQGYAPARGCLKQPGGLE